jgi:hypothetical protein
MAPSSAEEAFQTPIGRKSALGKRPARVSGAGVFFCAFFSGGRNISRILRPLVLAALLLSIVSGCCSSPHHHVDLKTIQAKFVGPTTQSLTLPYYDDDVEAVVDPPVGWNPDPQKSSPQHVHQVWVSPTGATAYGVIHFKLPLPVGTSLALDGFLGGMKKSEGSANLISQEDDPNLPGIRFVAEGGEYTIRSNLLVDGWEGWAIYAGTRRSIPINPVELDMAERAREHTQVGQPGTSGK